MHLKGIIFDLGWTLLGFDGDIQTADPQRATDLGDFLNAQGLCLDNTAVFVAYQAEMNALRAIGWPLHYEYPARLAMLRALRRYLPHWQAADISTRALAASFESINPKWHLYTDTLDTLTALQNAGYRLGAVSNTNDGAHVHLVLNRCGLRPWLSPILMSDQVGLCKPHPHIFELVLQAWNLPSHQVVIVGDTLNADVLGAHNAGMRGIWLDRGLVNPWSYNEANRSFITPDATIKQLAELPSLLADGFDHN